jgi:hypothetical protein
MRRRPRTQDEAKDPKPDSPKVDLPVTRKPQHPAPRFLVRLVGASRAAMLFDDDFLHPVHD